MRMLPNRVFVTQYFGETEATYHVLTWGDRQCVMHGNAEEVHSWLASNGYKKAWGSPSLVDVYTLTQGAYSINGRNGAW